MTAARGRYVKVAVAAGLAAAILLCAYACLVVLLGTATPVRVMTSNSMCTGDSCIGYGDAFSATLHLGDLVFIQYMDPQNYSVNYPQSDIIVFQVPDAQSNQQGAIVASRIVERYQDQGGVWRFQTKGDGNGANYPSAASLSELDSHSLWTSGVGVAEDAVFGKVVFRVPYAGLGFVFFMDNSAALPVIVMVAAVALAAVSYLPRIMRRRRRKRFEVQDNKCLQL